MNRLKMFFTRLSMYMSISSVIYLILQLHWQSPSKENDIGGYYTALGLFIFYILLAVLCGVSVIRRDRKLHVIEECIIFSVSFLGINLAAYLIKGYIPYLEFGAIASVLFSIISAPSLTKLLSKVRHKFKSKKAGE